MLTIYHFCRPSATIPDVSKPLCAHAQSSKVGIARLTSLRCKWEKRRGGLPTAGLLRCAGSPAPKGGRSRCSNSSNSFSSSYNSTSGILCDSCSLSNEKATATWPSAAPPKAAAAAWLTRAAAKKKVATGGTARERLRAHPSLPNVKRQRWLQPWGAAAWNSAAGRGWHAIEKIDGSCKVSLYGSDSVSMPLKPPDNHPVFLPDAAFVKRTSFIISPLKSAKNVWRIQSVRNICCHQTISTSLDFTV